MHLDAEIREALAKAALRVAATQGWRGVSLFDLAAAAGRPIGDFYGATLTAAVDCVEEAFDRAVGEGLSAPDASQPLRDRLFDLIMQRFEAMEPHRAAVLAMEPAGDPVALAHQHLRNVRLAEWVIALAGIEAEGVTGKARAQGLAVIIAQTRAAWRQDTAGDFARTMSALDKGLRRAEDTFGRFAGFEGAKAEEASSGPSAAAGATQP
jgi:AcrR family transcriptional regulator